MGEIEIGREYEYCGDCKEGRFALDEQLGLWDRNWSESLAKKMVWLSGKVNGYEEAEEVLARIGNVNISDSTVWRQTKKWGVEFKKLEEERKAKAVEVPKRGEQIAPKAKRGDQRMGGAMDGAMVHIREEGWKELKVGCIFEIESNQSFDKKSKENVEVAHAVNNSYVAHLGGPETFGQLMWAEAKSRGWEEVFDTQIIGDGAPWIWNQTKEHFFDSRQTIDWYHATDHLYDAARLLYPNDSAASQRWFNNAETSLFQGQAEQIALTLQQQGLSVASYFDTNKRRMQYMELREDGFPIGSGMVESGAKQFKARFNGPGMRWSRDGLERLIPIRASVMSGNFDSLWEQLYYSPPN